MHNLNIYLYEHFREFRMAYLEIDKVNVDALLPVGTSPTIEKK